MDLPTTFGSYRVTRELSSNQTARICEAHDSTLERRVILQTPVNSALDPTARQAFLKTARAMAASNHPHVVTVFEIAEDTTPYIVFETINEVTLRDSLRFFPPSVAEALRIGREIAEALVVTETNGLTPVELTLDNVWLEPAAIDAPIPKPTRAKLRDFRLVQQEDAVRDRLLTLRWFGELLAQLFAATDKKEPLPPRLVPFLTALRQSDQKTAPPLSEVAVRLKELEQQARRRPTFWMPVVASSLMGISVGVAGMSVMTTAPIKPSPTSTSEVATVSKQDLTDTKQSASIAIKTSVPDPIPESKPTLEPLNPAWLKFVGMLPKDSRLQAISIEMQRRNPGFDGQLQELWLEDGEIQHATVISDNVVDLMPLRAIPTLKKLSVPGSKSRSGIVEDLSPLADFELEYLRCGWTRVKDLSPISKMPLKLLRCGGSRVGDLSPIANMPLEDLEIWGNPIRDLSPLKTLQNLKRLQMSHILAADISAISGLPITELICEELRVKDWSPLKTLPLEKLRITYDAARHAELLRAIPTLQEINGKPASEVLDGK